MVALCNVVGNISDVTGSPQAATIKVRPDVIFYDDTTTPDTVIIPVEKTFTVAVDGIVDFDLAPSDLYKVAYQFEITTSVGDSFKFSASIPSGVASVELASLLPTPFTTDRLATGALRIAKELITNVDTQPYIIEGLQIIKSLTPPPAPTIDPPVDSMLIWEDISNGRRFYWNNDSNGIGWMSQEYVTSESNFNVDASGEIELPFHNPYSNSELVSILYGKQNFTINHVNPPTLANKYDLTFYLINTSAPPNEVQFGSVFTTNGQTLPYNVSQLTFQTVFSNRPVGMKLKWVKVGTPGAASIRATTRYRFIVSPGT